MLNTVVTSDVDVDGVFLDHVIFINCTTYNYSQYLVLLWVKKHAFILLDTEIWQAWVTLTNWIRKDKLNTQSTVQPCVHCVPFIMTNIYF